MSTLPTPEWQIACAAKKQKQWSLLPLEFQSFKVPDEMTNVIDVPRTCGLLTPRQLEITELDDIEVLLAKLASGEWSSVEVVTAYCRRAALSHVLVNCLTEIMFDSALEDAAKADAYLAKTGKTLGPLHGLPVSLKDQFDIQGVECTMGWASWLGRISEKDAVVVKILRDAGAIFYVRTNVPQTLMMCETTNHVFGRTTNPRNRTLTCGGSSGGEGALLALKGSIVGLGTDIGGSIRIPSSFNGLFGLRSTMRRLPYEGATNSLLGLESIESVIGPLARTQSGVIRIMRTILDGEPWRYDPKVVTIPFRDAPMEAVSTKGKLAFGLMLWDGVVMPHPPVQRALAMVSAALRKAGHVVIPWELADSEEANTVAYDIYTSDGGAEYEEVTKLTGEPLLPNLPSGPGCSAAGLMQLNLRRDAFRKKMLDQWEATASVTTTGRPIDGLIAPMAPHGPCPHGEFDYLAYAITFNCRSDWPAYAFPVDVVNPELDKKDLAYKPVGPLDQTNYDRYTGPERYKDGTIGLQLAGRRFEEESLIGLTKVVMDALALAK